MQESYIIKTHSCAIKTNEKKFCLLIYNSCFGIHGELSVLLRNVKFYFDVKQKNKQFSDAILKVIICNIKHIIHLCSLYDARYSLPIFFGYEKNTWQYYKEIKTPTKIKQIYLEMALSEYLLIENYKNLMESIGSSIGDDLKKFIKESEDCLICLNQQINNL